MIMTVNQENIEELREEYSELEKKLSDPELLSRPQNMVELGKKLKEVGAALRMLEEETRLRQELLDAESFIADSNDSELKTMAEEDRTRIEKRLADITNVGAEKNKETAEGVVMEIRPGAGGEEAALFAGEIARMYLKFAERSGWKIKGLEENSTSLGGRKEVIFRIHGRGAFQKLMHESGVHRVQRIPETEKIGRVHTSTVTVVVIPEAKETDFELKPQDVRIDVQRATGPGGQNVNKRETAVRVIHLPTGIIVVSQEERTQQSNKEAAMSIMRSKLLAIKKEEETKAKSEIRKTQIGTGDRSDKIRTYNFPQDRVTDHRIKKSWHNLAGIMEGGLDEIIQDVSALNNTTK